MSIPAQKVQLVNRQFVLLFLGHFFQALGWTSMILFPLYLDHLEASRAEIGVVISSAAMGGLLFRPVVGWSLDVLGRKPTLIWGTLLLILSLLIVGFVKALGPLVYIHRVVYGIGTGALFTGYFTFAADIVPISRRTEGLALFGISGLLPLALTPFVIEMGIRGEALRLFFPMVGGVILVSLGAVLLIREPVRQKEKVEKGFKEALAELVKPVTWSVWWATIVFAGMICGFMTFVTVSAANRGVDQPAIMWGAYALAACSVRLFGGSLPDRIGTHNLIAPALGCYCIAMLVAAGAQDVAGFLVAGAFGGVGHGYVFPVLASQVVSRTPLVVRGTSVALFTAIPEFITLGLAPLLGAFSDQFSDAAMFSLVASVALLGLVLWAFLEHFSMKHVSDLPTLLEEG
jgi:MFS family permease